MPAGQQIPAAQDTAGEGATLKASVLGEGCAECTYHTPRGKTGGTDSPVTQGVRISRLSEATLPSLISSPEGWGEMGTSVSLGSHQDSPALETRARKNPVSQATEARGQKTTDGCGAQQQPLLQNLIQRTAYVRVCEAASVMPDSVRRYGQ